MHPRPSGDIDTLVTGFVHSCMSMREVKRTRLSHPAQTVMSATIVCGEGGPDSKNDALISFVESRRRGALACRFRRQPEQVRRRAAPKRERSSPVKQHWQLFGVGCFDELSRAQPADVKCAVRRSSSSPLQINASSCRGASYVALDVPLFELFAFVMRLPPATESERQFDLTSARIQR